MSWQHAVKPEQATPGWCDVANLPDKRVQVVVPYTEPAVTREALAAAKVMTKGLAATIKLVAVQVLPYPAPFYCPATMREHLEAELLHLADSCHCPVEVNLVLCRTHDEGYRHLLPPHSAVLIGTRKRWWHTREERLARTLRKLGHNVALVEVEGNTHHA